LGNDLGQEWRCNAVMALHRYEKALGYCKEGEGPDNL
jgi:hypothetical protein